MLSSVLKSKKAIQVNIQIMLVFSKVREFFVDSLDLNLTLKRLKEDLQIRIKTWSWYLLIWIHLLRNRKALLRVGKLVTKGNLKNSSG